jgi:signal transduction histidine kinase/ActR/RegA family two-component response regulator
VEQGKLAGRGRSEALLEGQNHALELIAGNAPLHEVLAYVNRLIESQSPGSRCSVLLLEEGCLRLGAADSFPDEYNRMVDGIPIGPCVGSCGTAAYRGTMVAVQDIASDPLWAPYPEAAQLILAHGLRACWSTPIIGPRGAVLGTFAVYYDAPSPPRAEDVHLVQVATHIAGIAIERHRADRALEQRAAQLADAARAKDEYLALLAHELRNPLAPIVTSLELMRAKVGDPAAIEKYRAVIERQARQLTRLVDDLLDVSRITRGKVTLRPERTTAAALFARALEASRPFVEQRGHELTVILPDEPLELDVDPARIAQVLSNLITNSAKYTDDRGHIEVRASRDGDAVVLSVRDDGIGIAPDMLERVFDLFMQAPLSLPHAQGGLGIGLTLVKRLVELHGGSVVARSEGRGKGSELVVRLPAARGAGAPAAPRAPPCARPQASPLRVLLVDDNIDAVESLAEALRAKGNEVRVAHDGEEALAQVRAFAPGAAVVDIGLPGIDGYEVARRMRDADPRPSLRLVALTGYGQEADLARARAAGFDAHLVKPSSLDQIEAAVAGPSPQDETIEGGSRR